MLFIDNAWGRIVISNDIIANIVGYAAGRCYGIVGMSFRNPADNLVSLVKKNTLGKGIQITSDADGISIAMHVIVNYGYNIKAVCESVVSNVKYLIEKATGIPVKNVDVFVDSMKVE